MIYAKLFTLENILKKSKMYAIMNVIAWLGRIQIYLLATSFYIMNTHWTCTELRDPVMGFLTKQHDVNI